MIYAVVEKVNVSAYMVMVCVMLLVMWKVNDDVLVMRSAMMLVSLVMLIGTNMEMWEENEISMDAGMKSTLLLLRCSGLTISSMNGKEQSYRKGNGIFVTETIENV